MAVVIYSIAHIDSGKVYVGQTKDLRARWACHKYSAKHKSRRGPLHEAIAEFGPSRFTVSKLEIVAYVDADAAERKWIALLSSNKPGVGYNIESGGRVGQGMCSATKLKISKANKGKRHFGFRHSPHTMARIAATKRANLESGRTSIRSGWNHTEAARAKMAAAKVGYRPDMSWLRDDAAKAEWRRKNSEAHKSEKHVAHARANAEKMRGSKLTDEHKAKCKAALKARWQDPEYVARVMAGRKLAREKKAKAIVGNQD